MRIGIIADDLTGAADTATPFAMRGRRAHVAVNLTPDGTDRFRDSDVLSLITDTRDSDGIDPAVCLTAVRQATRLLQAWSAELLYKKIDSTLRGQLRRELDAMRPLLPGRIALVCPAFPANGRTVRQGILSIHGVPWSETDFAASCGTSQPPFTVRAAFGYAQDPRAAEITLETLRNGIETTGEAIRQGQRAGAETFFCDAETSEDLDVLAQIILSDTFRYLPVGSAGLASALAARLPARPREGTIWSSLPFMQGRVLVVVGSLNPVSRRQVACLMAKAGIGSVRYPKHHENDDSDVYARSLLPVIEEVGSLFAQGQRIVFLCTEDLPQENITRRVSKFLPVESPLFRQIACDSLIMTGGDTSLHFCRCLQATAIEIAGETDPGIVQGHLISAENAGQMFHNLPVIVKAGGFGTDETLARIVGLE